MKKRVFVVLSAIAIGLIALSAYGQRLALQYKVTKITPYEAMVSCYDGTQPSVKSYGSLVVISCRDQK